MTIAAGILCTDGIVLCADSEVTSSSMKTTRTKIFTSWRHGDVVRAAIAIAGDYDFAKAAIQYTGPMLTQPTPPTVENIRSAFEDAVGDVYENHVWKNPVQQRDFNLMVAAWGKDQGFRLFKTVETVVVNIGNYDVMGSGGDLADYILKKYYHEDITVAQAVAVAIYMLAEVKRHGQGCGGDTHISVLEEHRYSEVLEQQVHEYEAGMAALDKLTRQVVRVSYDPDKTAEDYSKAIDKVAAAYKVLRGPMVENDARRREAARVAQSPTHDPQSLPPSQE